MICIDFSEHFLRWTIAIAVTTILFVQCVVLVLVAIRICFPKKTAHNKGPAQVQHNHREPGQPTASVNSQYSDTDKPDDSHGGQAGGR